MNNDTHTLWAISKSGTYIPKKLNLENNKKDIQKDYQKYAKE